MTLSRDAIAQMTNSIKEARCAASVTVTADVLDEVLKAALCSQELSLTIVELRDEIEGRKRAYAEQGEAIAQRNDMIAERDAQLQEASGKIDHLTQQVHDAANTRTAELNAATARGDELYTLNQRQADALDAAQAASEAKDATITEQAAEIERLKTPPPSGDGN